jgi:tetratricopeptide (TPR) repeat protein
VDNLETVDDEELLSFLREIPDPTKVIVTTRHRIDIAYTIRLAGMPEPDAQALMVVEAARKNVELPAEITGDLYRRTGGLPLAIVWSIGLISLGHSVDSVLRRLGSGHSDIARFCFAESVARIRERDAYRLLLALALFESHVSRAMLGEVAGLGADVIGRDDGLAALLQLSLVEQKGERFFLLPLTQSYALDELAVRPELERELREAWIACLINFAQPYNVVHSLQPSPLQILSEGRHLAHLARWSQEQVRPDVFLSILPALLYYLDTTGDWVRLLTFGQVGLELAALTGSSQEIPRIQCALAWVYGQQGRYQEAELALESGLAITNQIGDVMWQIEILGRYSQTVRRQGELSKAEEYFRQAFQLLGAIPERQTPYIRADLEYEMGKIARDRGDWKTAGHYFYTARSVFSIDEDNPLFNIERAWGILGNVGYVAHQRGELDEAHKYYLQCLTFFRQSGGKGNLATQLVRLAALEEQRGNSAMALDYAREALEWSRKLGMVQERVQAEAIVGRLGDGTAEPQNP